MEIFGNYKIKDGDNIGDGTFGFVNKIDLYNIDNHYCGAYAKKTFSISNTKMLPYEDMFKERFRREVIGLSECAHKYVAPVYIANLNAPQPYFIMGLAECDLAYVIKNENLNDEQKINILKMILEGMKHIHDKNFLHRDIKPQNILKFSNGIFKISDFGLLKNIDPNDDKEVLTQIGTKMGTGDYMAPEIKRDYEYTYQTDIYAIGQVMDDLKISDIEFKPITDKARHFDKNQRYKKIDEIIHDLNLYELNRGSAAA